METSIVYWDTSTLLSALFNEERSDEARRLANSAGLHLLSSLAWAELHAALARAIREQHLPEVLIDATETAVGSGPWRHVRAVPEPNLSRAIARRWAIRGADLWHLALAKTLQTELPEIAFATFDKKLAEAAAGEGLPAP